MEWVKFEFRERFYCVNSLGEVKSLQTGIILKQRIDADGYPIVTLGADTKRLGRRIHRLVAENLIENPNGYKEVNHIDGNKQNNTIANLEWCTRSHNVKHCFDVCGRVSSKGVKNGRAKLSEDDVFSIRNLLKDKVTRYKIAKMFNVSWTIIDYIMRGKNWTHI